MNTGPTGANGQPRQVSRPDAPSHKIRRNDPCPCGSGKKAKKCCLPEILALASVPPEVRKRAIVSAILGKVV